MRDIKFRAWDKNKKVMLADYSSLGFTVEIMDGDFIVRNGEIATELGGKERFSLMQYTGLKDKTGKEIYEGDIVNTFEKGRATGFGVVVYRDGGFQVYDDRDTMRDANNGHESSVEVIGNVYENSELINQSEL